MIGPVFFVWLGKVNCDGANAMKGVGPDDGQAGLGAKPKTLS